MLVLTNIGKQISKPKKGKFLYHFFREKGKTGLNRGKIHGREVLRLHRACSKQKPEILYQKER